MPAGVEVCPLQLPGRERRLPEKAFTRMEPLVEAIASAILPYLDKPFAFFGHSMGGIIGFELARRLRGEYGLKPEQLFVSGRRAPQIPSTKPVTYNLPEDELIEELRRLNGTPKEVLEHPELLSLLLPVLRADFEVIQTYQYIEGPPLDCPISAFGGLEDADVGRDKLEGWREQTTAAFALRILPGDHFFLHSSRATLLRILSQEIGQVLNKLNGEQGF